MKQILKSLLSVSFVIIAYFVIRFALSLYPDSSMIGSDTTAILGVVFAFLVFVLQYTVNPEKSIFTSLGFLLFFAAGILFWTPGSALVSYSLQAAVLVFFLFSLFLLFISFKSIKKGSDDKIAKNIGHLMIMCSVYLLILPAVGLAEIIF